MEINTTALLKSVTVASLIVKPQWFSIEAVSIIRSIFFLFERYNSTVIETISSLWKLSLIFSEIVQGGVMHA